MVNMTREGEGWVKTDRSGWSSAPVGLSKRSAKRKAMAAAGHFPRTLVSDGGEPFEYFALPRAGRKPDGVSGHPNQKPLALMRWLIAKLPGRVILDCFAGSGTTALAAEAEGRECILIEKEPAYCDIIRKRLRPAQRLLS